MIGSLYYTKNMIDGIIFISTYPCGIDSLVNNLAILKNKDIPILNLVIDENITELSLETKIKVLKIVASIDNKIDSYFPNYKDTIKEKYSNFKGAVAVLYLETINKFCDKVGENVCNEAREDFNNMKESFGYTWDILKEVLTKSKDKASLILSEWYKSIK